MFKIFQKPDKNLNNNEEKLIRYIRTVSSGVPNISVANGKPTWVKMFTPFELFAPEEIAKDIKKPLELTDLEEYLLGTIKQMGWGMISVQVMAGYVVSQELPGTFISFALDKNQPIAYSGNR